METMDLARRTSFVADELESLFKFIPSPQLLTFRQVSKQWEEVAQMVLRKRRDIKLTLTTDNFDSRTNWDFLQFLNDSPENVFVAPVMNIKNANRELEKNLEEGRICVTFQIIREICRILGNREIIKELIIEDGENVPHFTSDFVLALLSHLPTLGTLEISKLQLTSATSESINPKLQLPSLKQIDFGYERGYCDVKKVRNLLKTILESSPNLQSIFSETHALRDVDVISMLRDAKHLPKMKEITLTKSAELEILLQSQPKLKLHSLEIETKDKDVVDSKKLFKFLQQQAVNLKSLECDGSSLVPKSILTIPVLPLLEELTFEPWESGCLLSVNYGRQTPALKSLTITSTESSFHSWEEFLSYKISSEMPPCFSLEEMHVYISGGVVRQTGRTYQKIFDNWKNLFPNIKKLRFGNPEQFDIEQFSKCWPKLETLTLEFDRDDEENEEEEIVDLDEILFGISQDWKKEIEATEEEWENVPAPEVTRMVANLESLKELKVELVDFGGAVTLTDFAVYFGLRHMQNLRKLEIIDPQQEAEIEGFGWSTKAFDFLVKNLPKLEKLNVLGQKWERGDLE